MVIRKKVLTIIIPSILIVSIGIYIINLNRLINSYKQENQQLKQDFLNLKNTPTITIDQAVNNEMTYIFKSDKWFTFHDSESQIYFKYPHQLNISQYSNPYQSIFFSLPWRNPFESLGIVLNPVQSLDTDLKTNITQNYKGIPKPVNLKQVGYQAYEINDTDYFIQDISTNRYLHFTKKWANPSQKYEVYENIFRNFIDSIRFKQLGYITDILISEDTSQIKVDFSKQPQALSSYTLQNNTPISIVDSHGTYQQISANSLKENLSDYQNILFLFQFDSDDQITFIDQQPI